MSKECTDKGWTPGDYTVSNLRIESLLFDWEQHQINTNGLSVEGIDADWFPEGHWSYAAFSIKETKRAIAPESGNPLKVKVHLTKVEPFETVQVQAIQPDEAMGKATFISEFPGLGALGTLEPTVVNFDKNGNSVVGLENFVPLNVMQARFDALGVGIYDIKWKWQYRKYTCTDGWNNFDWGEWEDIMVTNHRIFITLAQPKWPWTTWPIWNREDRSTYPTIGALMVACKWAKGSKNYEDAAEKITDQLFACGKVSYNSNCSYLKTYTNEEADPNSDEEKNYNDRYFFFSDALARLMGGIGQGDCMNCEDCAHMVVALVNILGGELRVGYLQGSTEPEATTEQKRFSINPIRVIGYKSWDATKKSGFFNPIDNKYYFTYHAIAWQNARKNDRSKGGDFTDPDIKIYDACLQFGDEEPYVSPTKNKFGTCSDQGYRSTLASSDEDGCKKAIPQQSLVQRTVIL